MTRPRPVLDRVDRSAGADGCWPWDGWHRRGYGGFSSDGRTKPAHRVIYELLVGPIPDGMHLDHLCLNRGCVNPSHLEPVTPRENVLRGRGHTAINARKQVCIHGHDNWLTYAGHRKCMTCQQIRNDARPRRTSRRGPTRRLDGSSTPVALREECPG